MRRGTTPTIQLTADNMSFKDCSLIIVTMKSKDKTIVERRFPGDIGIGIYEDEETGEEFLQFTLTQQETLKFPVGIVQVQIKAKTNAGTVVATNIIEVESQRILNDEVI